MPFSQAVGLVAEAREETWVPAAPQPEAAALHMNPVFLMSLDASLAAWQGSELTTCHFRDLRARSNPWPAVTRQPVTTAASKHTQDGAHLRRRVLDDRAATLLCVPCCGVVQQVVNCLIGRHQRICHPAVSDKRERESKARPRGASIVCVWCAQSLHSPPALLCPGASHSSSLALSQPPPPSL